MIPTDKAEASQTQSISLEYELAHAPEKVWRALTDPVLLAEWLLPVIGFDLRPGAEFSFKTQAYPGWDGTVSCRLVEIETHRKLRYTWSVPFLDTVVTFTLTPTGPGTRLSIEQTGFEQNQKRELGGARYGWNMMGERLVELLGRMS